MFYKGGDISERIMVFAVAQPASYAEKAPFPPRREPPKNTPFGESANTMSASLLKKCAWLAQALKRVFARPSPSHSLASLPSVSGKNPEFPYGVHWRLQ
ncbi:MAG: hypothetical protein ACLUKN_12295 [Bacilli bacterium]